VYSAWRCSCLPSLEGLGSVEIKHNYLVLGHSPQGFSVRLFAELVDRTLLESFFLNLVMLISSYLSDRYRSRGVAIALIATLAVAGYSIYLGKSIQRQRTYPEFFYSAAANDKFTTYGALYLMVPGVYGVVPIMTAWMANNSEPYYRRATSIAVWFIASNSVGLFCLPHN